MAGRLHHLQDFAQAIGAHLARYQGIGQQRLGFGAEHHAVRGGVVVQRLDAHAVADKQQLLRAQVPDGEGIHAIEPLDEGLAPFHIGAQHHLGVAAGLELVPAPLQLGTQLAEVVDLAAVGDGGDLTQTAMHGRHWLTTAFEVDDRQPAMAQPDRPVDPQPAGIGPTQGHGVGHALQGVTLCFHVLAVGQPSSDSTHSLLLVNGLSEAFQVAVLGQQHARLAMDVACWRRGLGSGVEFVEQVLQGHGRIQAREWLAWRFLECDRTYRLQAQPRKLVQGFKPRYVGGRRELVQQFLGAAGITCPDAQLVVIPARCVEYQSRVDQPGVSVNETEVQRALADDVDEAAVAGDRRIPQAGGELHGVEHGFAGDREVRAHTEYAMQLELARTGVDPADEIQGMDHLAGYATGGAVVVDAILAPVEIGAHQLPIMPLDPLTQLPGGLRVAFHQVQRETADVLQRS
ncbi:hypothetical protein D9M68_621720 [compost metagenome]